MGQNQIKNCEKITIMEDRDRFAGLMESLKRLRGFRSTAAAVRALASRHKLISEGLHRALLEQVPAFERSGNVAVIPEQAEHGAAHTAHLLDLLSGASGPAFDFVRAHVCRRAEQKFPLEAVLHAYRLGHRLFSQALRQALTEHRRRSDSLEGLLSAAVDFSMDYTDAISAMAVAEYTAHVQLQADVASDRRAQILATLLTGYDESDARMHHLLRSAGYMDQRLSHCVALAQSYEVSEMANPERARRMLRSIESTLQSQGWRCIMDLHEHCVTMIFSRVRRVSGWSAPSGSLCLEVARALRSVGISARIGVSQDVRATTFIPAAHRQARLAMGFAKRSVPLVLHSDIPLARLVTELVADQLDDLLPQWSQALLDADRRSQGKVLKTLRAYADHDMNVLRAARALGQHPNTVYGRLDRILELTGRDPRKFHALNELLIAATSKAFELQSTHSAERH